MYPEKRAMGSQHRVHLIFKLNHSDVNQYIRYMGVMESVDQI